MMHGKCSWGIAMKRLGQISAISAGLTFCGASLITQAMAQMALPGQFSVASGAATYTIPIQVPAGIQGVSPQLALVYNSQSGDDIAGLGWSLSGLSRITRCPRTMAQDGVRGRVNNDIDDRYCLDGQRLMIVGAGAYGGDKTEYRTEVNGFAQVLASAEAGALNGPGSFIVKTKAGLTIEYGRTEDSRIEVAGKADSAGHGVVNVWAVNKVMDAKGNYYSVSYTEDNPMGNFWVRSISYASGAITFDYVGGDGYVMYQAGVARNPNSRLLGKIHVKSGSGTEIGSYKLAYIYSNPNYWASSLDSIQYCSGATVICLPTVVFSKQKPINYADGVNHFNVVVNGVGEVADPGLLNGRTFVGDIDGDGKSDMVHLVNDSGSVFTRISKGDGTYKNVAFNSSGLDGCLLSCGIWLTGDVDGDGKMDLVHLTSTGGKIFTWLSNGDGTYRVSSTSSSIDSCVTGCGEWMQGDIDGDGRTDLIHLSNAGGNVFTWLSSGNGLYTVKKTSGTTDTCITGCGSWSVGDFNGDGKTDLAHFTTNSGKVVTWLSNGDGSFIEVSYSDTALDTLLARGRWSQGDINVDGLTEFIHLSSDGKSGFGPLVNVWYSKGDGRFDVRRVDPGGLDPCVESASCGTWLTGDFNGDGKTDLLHITDANIFAWLSSVGGNFTVTKLPATSDACLKSCGQWFAADVNGDGVTDVVHIIDNTGLYKVWVNSRAAPDNAILGVSGIDGNSAVSVTYDLLSKLSPDTRTANSYPIINVAPKGWAVSSVTKASGLPGKIAAANTYKYGNAVASLGTGRGGYGIEWIQVKDENTGLVSRICYNQVGPGIGWPAMPLQSSSMTATTDVGMPACSSLMGALPSLGALNPLNASGSKLLSLALSSTYYSSYAPSDTSYASPSSSTVPGQIYQVYGTDSLSQGRDWDGSAFIALPAIFTSVNQDNWGNITRINVQTLKDDGSTTSGYSKTTTNVFDPPDLLNWQLGRLRKSSVTVTTP